MSNHLERLEAAYATRRAKVAGTRPDVVEVLSADLRAALDELEQARAQLVQAREEGAGRAALGTSPAIWCWSRHPDHPLPCGRFAGHEGPHVRGERRWDDTAPQQPEPDGGEPT